MVDSTAPLCTVTKTVHNVAAESIVCRRSGSQIARVAHAMQTLKTGVRMVCARRTIFEPLRQQTVDSSASLCSI
eukprot:9492126-Lingulodinium_polyedra.AAC.1